MSFWERPFLAPSLSFLSLFLSLSFIILLIIVQDAVSSRMMHLFQAWIVLSFGDDPSFEWMRVMLVAPHFTLSRNTTPPGWMSLNPTYIFMRNINNTESRSHLKAEWTNLQLSSVIGEWVKQVALPISLTVYMCKCVWQPLRWAECQSASILQPLITALHRLHHFRTTTRRDDGLPLLALRRDGERAWISFWTAVAVLLKLYSLTCGACKLYICETYWRKAWIWVQHLQPFCQVTVQKQHTTTWDVCQSTSTNIPIFKP